MNIKKTASVGLLLVVLFLNCNLLTKAADKETVESSRSYWPQWRGPMSTGVAPESNPPIEWSEIKNVRWKTAVPGKGHSSPIVWDDRVFVTTAVPVGKKLEPKYSNAPGAHDNLPVTQQQKFVAIAIDRKNGKIVWETELNHKLPHEGGHFTASLASASPVTDGERFYAHFGSFGLFCLNYDGKLIWKTSLGTMQSKHAHGEGSSPALYGETLIVNWDHEGDSFVVALDKRTGKERWKGTRDEVTSWASPIVVVHDDKPQVIICGTNRVRSYDLQTGTVIWECGGMSANIVATPVATDGMLFAASSYYKQSLLAISLEGARGNITDSKNVIWKWKQRTPYVPSPLLYDGSLYFLRHYQGILSRVTAKTGEEPSGPFRLGDLRDIYASPVGAANRVYITDRSGTTVVISNGEKPEFLARNSLNDSFSASAAIAGNEIFLRGERKLYCISEK